MTERRPFYSRQQAGITNEVDENVSQFLNSYYLSEENRYHSLPRYFGGTLRRDREQSYRRPKSIVHSASGSALNASMDEQTNRSSERSQDVVRELKNYFRSSTSHKHNSIPTYPSSFKRYSNQRRSVHGQADDSGSEISSHSYKSIKSFGRESHSQNYDDQSNEFYDDNNEEYVVEQSKKSKFLRSSSIRSIKKFVNKIRGKKSSSSSAPSYHHQHLSYVEPPTNHRPYPLDYSPDRNAEHSTFVSHFKTSSSGVANENVISAESGLNTPSDTISLHGGGQVQMNLASSVAPSYSTEIQTPALCGILNHGNTCYINSIVQCLSNTDVLAEYFLTDAYYSDLRGNQKNAEKYGSQGNVTMALASFIASLWYKTYMPKYSEHFQNIVEQYSEQYRGGQQQDAQEFFIWLLDRVHEDLNIAVKRRYKLNKPRNKSEDEIASAAMDKHLEAHNSFISYHFHGLYLSSVTCPVCYKQSTQPDPFACVSLPVSQSTKKPLYVVMVFLNRRPRLVCFGLNADVTATFLEVKQCLSKATEVNVEQLILCDLGNNGFKQSFVDSHDITTLNTTKYIYCFETPSISSSASEIGEELICLISSQAGEGNNGRRFGAPVSLKVHREVSYGDLCRSILLSIRAQFKANLLVQDIPLGVFRLRVVDDYHLLAYVPDDVSMPMYSQSVDTALASQKKRVGPVHIKIMVEWQRDAKERYFNAVEETIVDHKSAQDLRHQEKYPETQTLHECLEEFTKDESLQWNCPDCRRLQDRAVKRTLFYWLPNVLTLHLKRNKHLPNGQFVKLDPLVKFPIYGLDLSEFMHHTSPGMSRRSRPTNGYRGGGRTKNGELYVDTKMSQCVYDLFAVCNHHGDSPNSGHYTAYCRNPVNGSWYCFDDQHVSRTDENHLVTNAAYLLFYERRLSRNANSCHNSTESGFVDHWYFKVYWSHYGPQFQQSNGNSGGGSRETLKDRDGDNSTNYSNSNAKDSPERPSSRQLFVALPPADTNTDVPLPAKRPDPPVGRLISIDQPVPCPEPPVNYGQNGNQKRSLVDHQFSAMSPVLKQNSVKQPDYVNFSTAASSSSSSSNNNNNNGKPSPFVRQQSYVRRISTNSVVETDL